MRRTCEVFVPPPPHLYALVKETSTGSPLHLTIQGRRRRAPIILASSDPYYLELDWRHCRGLGTWTAIIRLSEQYWIGVASLGQKQRGETSPSRVCQVK